MAAHYASVTTACHTTQHHASVSFRYKKIEKTVCPSTSCQQKHKETYHVPWTQAYNAHCHYPTTLNVCTVEQSLIISIIQGASERVSILKNTPAHKDKAGNTI